MTTNRMLLLGALVLALLAVSASAYAAGLPAQAAPSGPPDARMGRDLYARSCASCHGQAGLGDGASAPALGAQPSALGQYEVIAGLTFNDLFQVTKTGRMARMMPPWSGQLTDQQIRDTVAYIWTLHTSRAEVAMGQALYEQNCAVCHGTDGRGKGSAPGFTNFAATSNVSQDNWAKALNAGRNTMPAFAGRLREAEQRAVLEYVRSLSLGPLFREPLPKGSGIISGTIANGTTGRPAANLTLDLGIFDSTSLLESRTASTDAAGVYRFVELPTDPDLTYQVMTDYPAGLAYHSEPVSFITGTTTLDLPLTVYETTSDASGVRADRVHYIVEFEDGRALVAELLVFSLQGNRTYVGDSSGVLRLTLPAGAQDVELSDGELGDGRYVAAANGFTDAWPLLPGQGARQILFRYSLPYTGSTMELVRSLPYPVTAVNALVGDVGEKVSSAQLPNQSVRSTQNGNYINLSGQNLTANQPVTLKFTNLPAAGSGSGAAAAGGLSRGLLFGLVGAAGGAVLALLALTVWRGRAGAALAAPAAASYDDIVDTLAVLDAAYQAGDIPETAYRDRRLRLKAQLVDLRGQSNALPEQATTPPAKEG